MSSSSNDNRNNKFTEQHDADIPAVQQDQQSRKRQKQSNLDAFFGKRTTTSTGITAKTATALTTTSFTSASIKAGNHSATAISVTNAVPVTTTAVSATATTTTTTNKTTAHVDTKAVHGIPMAVSLPRSELTKVTDATTSNNNDNNYKNKSDLTKRKRRVILDDDSDDNDDNDNNGYDDKDRDRHLNNSNKDDGDGDKPRYKDPVMKDNNDSDHNNRNSCCEGNEVLVRTTTNADDKLLTSVLTNAATTSQTPLEALDPSNEPKDHDKDSKNDNIDELDNKYDEADDAASNDNDDDSNPETDALKTSRSTASTKNRKTLLLTTRKIKASSSSSNGLILTAVAPISNDAIRQDLVKQWPDWQPGVPMPYAVLCHAFARMEALTGRLQIQDILTTLFRQILLHHELSQEQKQKKEPQPNQMSSKQRNSSTKDYSDLYTVLYLCCNAVAPAYEPNVELGIGDAILIKAIAEATGSSVAAIKSKLEQWGDLGTVAASCKSQQKTLGGFFSSAVAAAGGPTVGTATTNSNTGKNALSAQTVLTTFREIAHTKGHQSQKSKVDAIKRLLVKAASAQYDNSAGGAGGECKYIIRGLQGKLRNGVAQSTVLISLAHALTYTVPTSVRLNATTATAEATKTLTTTADGNMSEYPEEARQYMETSLPAEKRLEAAVAIIKKAYSEVSSFDVLLDAALKVPLQELHRTCTLRPGIPVAPMLAKPTKSVQEVLKRLNGLQFTCEYKYDGERAQIHMLSDGTTKVFSRNLLDTSEKYPEVPLFAKESVRRTESAPNNSKQVDSFVLDAEVVAFNNKTGQLVPFQILSTRKKTEESAETAKVQVIVMAFDLMYLNGQSLLHRTLADRRQLLHEHFQVVPGKFEFAKSLNHTENGDTTVLEEFLDQAVKGQCEGLMVKTLQVNAIYEPSRRSLNWLKLKKDYLDGLGDSVDLVPLGAYHGRGKRTGVYGAYLLACYDPDTEEYQSVCKIGTGFSEEDLKSLASVLNDHIIPAKSRQYNVSDALACDVWFDPAQVWEVKAADLSQSSAHRGAVGKIGGGGHGSRGIGLRFPRFERKRDDKKPEQATTSDEILDMYYQQDSIQVSGGRAGSSAADIDDDDYDGI